MCKAFWIILRAVVLALVASSIEASSVSAAECLPLPTRPSDSVRLLQFPVRRERIEEFFAACRTLPEDSQSQFAQATIMVLAGDLNAAIGLLEASNKPVDPAQLLLADILTERGDPAQAQRAAQMYQPLVNRESLDAAEGLGIALLKAFRDVANRRRAVDILQDAAERGATSARARLGAALVSTAVDNGERSAGLELLEAAATQGNIAAEIELAKILARPGPDCCDQERAVALLEPAAAAGAAEAQQLLAMHWKNGWSMPSSRSARLFEEVDRSAARVDELKRNAQKSGDHIGVFEAQDKLIQRQIEVARLVAEHKDLRKALELLRKSAAREYLPAVLSLGTILAFTPTRRSDFYEGIDFLTQGFVRGDGSAAVRLGILHEMKIEHLRPEEARRYYRFAKDKGSRRAILALDRLSDQGSQEWSAEVKNLDTFVAGLRLGDADATTPNRRTFARGLLDDAPYFEAERWTRLAILDQNGRQLFGSDLTSGDKVRLSPGEFIKLVRLGALDKSPPLGHIIDRGQVIETTMVSKDLFAPVFAALPKFSGDIKTKIESFGDSGIVFRALDGPENGIVVHDPLYLGVLRGTTDPELAPYGTPSSHLKEQVDVRVPQLPRVAGVVRGGTQFEIVVDGRPILKNRVPDRTNLYLDFEPRQLRFPLDLSWPESVDLLPNEIVREWTARPGAAFRAGGESIGWLYTQYDPAPDGLLATMLEINAPIAAFNAELKNDYQKGLRLRTAGYHLSLIRHGGASLEAISAKAALAGPFARLGRLDQAIHLEEEAVQALEQLDVRPPAPIVEQLLRLAAFYRQRSDLGRAITTARQAL